MRGTSISQIKPKNIIESSEDLTSVTDTNATIAKLHTEFIGVVIFSINKIKKDGFFVDTVKSDSLHTVELHGTMLKVQSFDADLLYWAGTYGDNITSNGEFCINFLSRSIAVEDTYRTGFSIESITKAIELLTLIYRKNLAESLDINTNFKKLRSPYCNEKVQDMLLIQDLKVFNTGSDKVECAVCVKFVLKKRMRNHIGKHLVLDEIDPHPKNCGL